MALLESDGKLIVEREVVGARFDKYGKLSYIANFKNGKESGLCVEYREDGGITIFKWVNDAKKIIETIYP